MTSSTVPTPTRGIPLTLGAHALRVRFSFSRLRRMREALGDNVLEQDLTIDMLLKVLWYGIGGDSDPERNTSPLTIEQLDEEIDLENLQDVMQVIILAAGTKMQNPLRPRPAAGPEDSTSNQALSSPAPETSDTNSSGTP